MALSDLVICHVLMVRSVQGHLILVILKIKSLLPHSRQLARPETVVGTVNFLNQTLINPYLGRNIITKVMMQVACRPNPESSFYQ